MYKVAICDDDANICGQLDKYLKQMENEGMPPFEIEIFNSVEALHEYIFDKSVVFDIIFLDIEFPEMNGIEAGIKIRNNFRSEITQIIYISYYTQYMRELFQIQPANFIVKPLEYAEIEKTMTNIINKIFKQTEIFTYKIGLNEYRIELFKVLYFRSDKRKITIKTFKETLTNNAFYGKLSEISEKLVELDFFLANAYYLVNYYAVKDFQYKKIMLVNGECVNIGVMMRKSVRDMQMKKWREK